MNSSTQGGKDSDEDLFHTWIHPVLDLSRVSMSKDLHINTIALNEYLLAALAERDNQVLHDAAEKIRKAYEDDNGEMYCGDMLTAAKLIHPQHDGECDYR